MVFLANFTLAEQLAIIAVIMLLTIIVIEVLDCSRVFGCAEPPVGYHYGYEDYNGPAVWKQCFPESKGNYQSPINISTDNAACIPCETLKPLTFSSEYYRMPSYVTLYNDGHNLSVSAEWSSEERPRLSGGPLHGSYRFHSAHLRWGASDDEGSEHTVDLVRYAMELQAMHVRCRATDGRRYADLAEAARDGAVLAVAYLFKTTAVDNPYLEPIAAGAADVREPGARAQVRPFPLSWLAAPFAGGFFSYRGSLTYPPCAEGVKWLVVMEPMGVSPRQLRKLRRMSSCDGTMVSNARPVQEVNGRGVCFYD